MSGSERRPGNGSGDGDSGSGARDGSIDRLIAAARAARRAAHAPFSGFAVGAALELRDGTIVTGCNVESASYGLTTCAERVAIVKAVSEGRRGFTRLAVVADGIGPVPPCGACRQVLWELAGDLEIILADSTRETGRHRLRELLPHPFEGGRRGISSSS